jgi:hypothetical protein
MVGVAHPPLLLAMAPANSADLPGMLKVFAARGELAALGALLAPVAKKRWPLPMICTTAGTLMPDLPP